MPPVGDRISFKPLGRWIGDDSHSYFLWKKVAKELAQSKRWPGESWPGNVSDFDTRVFATPTDF